MGAAEVLVSGVVGVVGGMLGAVVGERTASKAAIQAAREDQVEQNRQLLILEDIVHFRMLHAASSAYRPGWMLSAGRMARRPELEVADAEYRAALERIVARTVLLSDREFRLGDELKMVLLEEERPEDAEPWGRRANAIVDRLNTVAMSMVRIPDRPRRKGPFWRRSLSTYSKP